MRPTLADEVFQDIEAIEAITRLSHRCLLLLEAARVDIKAAEFAPCSDGDNG